MYLCNLFPALYAGFFMTDGLSLQWNRSKRSALQDSYYSVQFDYLFGRLGNLKKFMLTLVLSTVEGHHPYCSVPGFACFENLKLSFIFLRQNSFEIFPKLELS